MDYYLSQIVQGVASGCIYGLLGLSMMFIYRSTRVFNFAQGELATATVFISWAMMKRMPPWFAIPAAMFVTFLLGMLIELGFLRIIRKHGELATIIATIGLYTIVNNLDGLVFGYDPLEFPSPIPQGTFQYFGVILSYQSAWIIFCTCVLSLLLFAFFKFTMVGIAFQGASEDSAAARLKGVRVVYLVAAGWGAAAVIGGIAGLLAAPTMFLSTNLMESVFLYAFAASVIGGLQSSFGALIGGVLVGVTENLAGTVEAVGSELKTVVVYVILVLFLLIRPRGLLGREEPRKI